MAFIFGTIARHVHLNMHLFLERLLLAQKIQFLRPSVLGCVLSLGICLDLLDYENLLLIRASYKKLEDSYKLSGLPLPENRNTGTNNDLLRRELDCEVIEHLHRYRRELNSHPSTPFAVYSGKEKNCTPTQASAKKIISNYAFAIPIASKDIFYQEKLMIHLIKFEPQCP